MLFNSLEFAVFLPLVFLCYWFVVNRNLKWQNFFIVCISYLFYGWWDWRFLTLIAFTTFCSFLSGILIEKYEGKRRIQKIISALNIVLNLSILGIFKYFNFFTENLGRLFEIFGFALDWVTLDILLPVGISFYTFQALSYTIDVYQHKLKPTHDAVSFFAYVSFFPQLVAGPIERATNLLPQFYVRRQFDYMGAVDGLRQILWGLFKKMVVADNCALAVNQIFGSYAEQSGGMLIIGAVLFTFQIYGDFSGYSDIAIGTARLFGFNLMQNFNHPYFSRDIAEFWRRWHISLTTWFRDYIYIPLGGSRVSRAKVIRNTFIIFLVSGFWHGANWTFVVWGAYHALLFMPLILMKSNRKHRDTIASGRFLPTFREFAQMLLTFILVAIGWIIFRAETIGEAWEYFTGIFTHSFFPLTLGITKKAVVASFVLFLVEWLTRSRLHALEGMSAKSYLNWSVYYLLIVGILFFSGVGATFIYFQF